MTKKIALVYDTNGWCWHYQALALQKYAPARYDVEIICGDQFRAADAPRYDAILFFSLNEGPLDLAQPEGADNVQKRTSYTTRVVSLAAHAGLILPKGRLGTTALRNRDQAILKLPLVNGMICVNPDLHVFCRKYVRSAYLPTGIDLDVFRLSENRPRFSDRRLRVGWCGQTGGASPKGYREILVPVMEQTPDVIWHLNTADARTALSQAEMVDWYGEIDLLLCTSAHEGTPMPPLEAAATGAMVLTTPVGDLWGLAGFHYLPPWDDQGGAAATIQTIVDELTRIGRWDDMMLRHVQSECRFSVSARHDWRVLAPRWLAFAAGDV